MDKFLDFFERHPVVVYIGALLLNFAFIFGGIMALIWFASLVF